MKTKLLNICVFAILLKVGLAQSPTTGFEIKTMKVSGNVTLLNAVGETGSMNAALSAGPDGLLLVDGFIRPLSEQLRETLGKLAPGPVRFQINTHWHGDHTGPNDLFGRESVIIAHPGVRQRVMTEQRPPWRDQPVPPQPSHAWPVITASESLSLHFNGEEIRLLHLPNAHTDGDTVVWFTGSRVVSLGDTIYLVKGEIRPSPDLYSNGDAESLAQGLASLIAQLPADIKAIPGHGPVLSLDELKAYHRILTTTIATVRQQMQAGRTLAEIKKRGLPAELSSLASWKLVPDQWIEAIHENLTGKQASVPHRQEVTFRTTDNVKIYGDLYLSAQGKSAPMIMLFHQGGGNARAEYEPLLPRLHAAGFNLLAIDQRAGGNVLGGTNRTASELNGNEPGYCAAYPDLVAALQYVKKEGFTGKRIAWGSSYSAALALRLGADHASDLAGVLAFSPASGEPMNGCRVETFIPQVSLPVLALRPGSEMQRESAQQQFALFARHGHQTFVAEKGVHGSSMLNPARAEGVEQTWQVVFEFLRRVTGIPVQ